MLFVNYFCNWAYMPYKREGLCAISHRFLSSSNVKKEKLFLIGLSVSTILQLVVELISNR